MIKYLIALLLFALPCLAGMGIGGFPYPGPGVMATSSGGYCSTTPTYSQDIVNDYWSFLATSKSGGNYTGTTSYNICAIAFHNYQTMGSLSGQTYMLNIYTKSGLDLATNLGGTSISGSTVSTGWNKVTFSTPINTGSSGFAVVIDGPEDGVNYFRLSANAADGSSEWNSSKWYPADGVFQGSEVGDIALRIYEWVD